MPADNIKGFRKDTLELLKELNSPVYRWPGGNFVSGYDWKDGLGPRDKRPPRTNPAWTGIEYNDGGLHEFIDSFQTRLNVVGNAIHADFFTTHRPAKKTEPSAQLSQSQISQSQIS